MKKIAFTLIELLVVISIITILASLLLPALGKAKAKSSQIKCAGNLKQNAVSFIMYNGDHDGVYPPAYYGWGASVWPGMSWFVVMTPYIKAGANATWTDWYNLLSPLKNRGGVVSCPSDLYSKVKTVPSYAYHAYCEPAAGIAAWELGGKRNSAMTHPAECFLMTEHLYSTNPDSFESCRITPFAMERFDYRHSGGVNTSFCDGHVSWIKSSFPIHNADADAQKCWYPYYK